MNVKYKPTYTVSHRRLIEIDTIRQRILNFVDKPWKITAISAAVSASFSTLLTILFGGVPIVGFLIGTGMAIIISYPIGQIIITTLERTRHQNLQLLQLNNELDTYADAVAHNMKNTVSTISLSSQIIARTTEPDSKAYEYAIKITQLTDSLADTIDSLLLLASVREEEVPTHHLDMKRILPKVQRRVDTYTADRNPQIQLPETWETAIGYEPWLIEVWVNLLSNAIKYGGDPAVIQLGSELLADRMTRFWVKDNGRGLTKEEIENLFQRFSKLERIEGHGLGLSIVSQIVSRLGGKVGVESKGKGYGSLFYFILPTEHSH